MHQRHRYFLALRYHGGAYYGWQRQPRFMSVQQAIEERMSLLLGFPVELTVAGRTDTGVHALLTYAHFDSPKALDTAWLTHRLNSFLPADIAVRYTVPVPPGAHARYDAIWRTYHYHIIDRKDPFLHDRAWRLPRLPDIRRMQQAADILLQYEDFRSFSKVKTDVKTFICRIREARWEQAGPHHLIFRITANRFLRNMVRALTGTLVEVGTGKTEPAEMHRIIGARNRSAAGPSAPARGLFLADVQYKPGIQAILDRAREDF